MALKPRRIALPSRDKPQLPVEVDRQHPLLRGVSRYWAFNERAGDVAYEAITEKSGSVAGLGWSNDGLEVTSADAAYLYSDSIGLPQTIRSLYVAFRFDVSISPSTPGKHFLETYEVSSDELYSVALGSVTGLLSNEVVSLLDNEADGVYYRTAVQNTIIAAGYHSICFSWNGSFYDIYIDSVKQPVVSGSKGHAREISGIRLQKFLLNKAHPTAYEPFPGGFLAVLLRDTAFTSNEIRTLHADPYAPIRKRRVLVQVAGGGGTTLTRTVSLQAVLSKTVSAQTSLSLAVAKARAVSAQLDSVLQALKALTASADMAVVKTLQTQAGLDVNVAESATSKLVSLDLAIKRIGNQLQSSLDLGVQVSSTQLSQLDVLIGQASSQLVSLDLALRKTLNLSSQLSTVVQGTLSISTGLDVNVIQGLMTSLSMAVQRVRQTTAKLDLYIGEASSIVFHPQVEAPEVSVYTPTIGKPVY